MFQISERSNFSVGVPYETSSPYMACSQKTAMVYMEEWSRGIAFQQSGVCEAFNPQCSYFDWSRTCSTFPESGGTCAGMAQFPNATVKAHGNIQGASAMMREIHSRGPIVCGIDAIPLVNYTGGIVGGEGNQIDHAISVAGWGTDPVEGKYWHVRNSWGEYWGELGWARVKFGALKIEEDCSWAVPGPFTSPENPSAPCTEDGSNCLPGDSSGGVFSSTSDAALWASNMR